MASDRPVLLITSMIGYGDLLYHTPFIRRLKKTYPEVHVWCFNTEPFLNNPNIDQLYRIKGPEIPVPLQFYLLNVLEVRKESSVLRHEHAHTIDYVSVNAMGIELMSCERELELHPGEKARAAVRIKLKEQNLTPKGFVVISPASGWKSRTLPPSFYAELVEILKRRGKTVVVVGRNIAPDYQGADADRVNQQERKGMVEGSWMKECISLVNQLSFHESAALFELAEYAVLGETGAMPLAATTPCPFVYIPQLMPPEFRLPTRCGQFGYGVEVVKRVEPYAGQADSSVDVQLSELPAWVPQRNDVQQALENLEAWIKREGV